MTTQQYIIGRIDQLKNELDELFKKNKLYGSILHEDYKDYIKHLENNQERYNPYIDSRIKFNGKRQLKRIMEDIKYLINEKQTK